MMHNTIAPQRCYLFDHSNKNYYCRSTCTTRATLQAPISNPTTTRVVNLPKFAENDPSLKSTWTHRAWVVAGCGSVLVSLAKSCVGAIESGHIVEPVVAGLVGYILADLGSGVYHWAIDNYGDASTPVFGSQIDAFQGHHRWPWTITKRQFANNHHALARAVMLAVVPIDVAVEGATIHAFVALFAGCIMMSQQFHAWAHTPKSRLPPPVVALQDAGILVSREMHMTHHKPPYDDNYCIVSGLWNEALDKNKVFEALEMLVFFRFGVRSRSWTETDQSWLEEESDDN